MSYVYWAITGQYSIINDPITGFVNTSRFTTLVIQTLAELSIDGQSFIHLAYSFAFLLYATFNPLLLFSPPNIHIFGAIHQCFYYTLQLLLMKVLIPQV